MFWIEKTEDGKSLVLFSQVSMKEYDEELSELGGIFLDRVVSQKSGEREGWVFSLKYKQKLDDFVERETNDVQSNSTQGLTLDDLYDLLLEAFDRIGALEKKAFGKS